MTSSHPVDVGRWRKIVELGSGRTGSVALCVEPESPWDEKTCGEHRHRVFHAVKRVNRQGATKTGALRRILQEKAALQALRGVREAMPDSLARCLYVVLAPTLFICWPSTRTQKRSVAAIVIESGHRRATEFYRNMPSVLH